MIGNACTSRANFFFGRTFDLDFGEVTMCACAKIEVRSGLYAHAARLILREK